MLNDIVAWINPEPLPLSQSQHTYAYPDKGIEVIQQQNIELMESHSTNLKKLGIVSHGRMYTW